MTCCAASGTWATPRRSSSSMSSCRAGIRRFGRRSTPARARPYTPPMIAIESIYCGKCFGCFITAAAGPDRGLQRAERRARGARQRGEAKRRGQQQRQHRLVGGVSGKRRSLRSPRSRRYLNLRVHAGRQVSVSRCPVLSRPTAGKT